MTAILGRMATCSGKVVTWEQGINSQLDLSPGSLAWDAEPKSKPGADGCYACAMPGVTTSQSPVRGRQRADRMGHGRRLKAAFVVQQLDDGVVSRCQQSGPIGRHFAPELLL
jgi:hypothetical protein